MDERSSYIILIHGLSETERIHRKAIARTSFEPLAIVGFPISAFRTESKQSEPRPSANRNRTQFVKSTPPPYSPETTSRAHLPVNNSSNITSIQKMLECFLEM